MRILQYQRVTQDPARDSEWEDSVYRKEIAEAVMARHKKDKSRGYTSNLRYRWKPYKQWHLNGWIWNNNQLR